MPDCKMVDPSLHWALPVVQTTTTKIDEDAALLSAAGIRNAVIKVRPSGLARQRNGEEAAAEPAGQ